jgi:hypothetical protein
MVTAWYFPHSSYEIYTIGGKLLKNVGNHISRSDEIPEIVPCLSDFTR